MSADQMSPDILADFLTESGELLEQLEGDLVRLERSPQDPELLNRVFRSLHTIKGSASFLALTNLVSVAHAAETALNAARGGAAVIDQQAMNLLLATVDLLKEHLRQVRAGEPLSSPDPALLEGLGAIGDPSRVGGGADLHQGPAADQRAAEPETPPGRLLELSPERADMFGFMLDDLDETLDRIDGCLARLRADRTRADAAEELAELVEGLSRASEFFGFEQMSRLAALLGAIGAAAPRLDDPVLGQVMARGGAGLLLLRAQADALRDRRLAEWPLDTLIARTEAVLRGEDPPADAVVPPDADPRETLRREVPEAAPTTAEGGAAAAEDVEAPSPAASAPAGVAGAGGSEAPAEHAAGAIAPKRAVEQTIRVEVERLEALMNLVGELVLQKNRIGAVARRVAAGAEAPADLAEAFAVSSGALDRVTSDIQLAVMRTRMQPLDKLFGRYPRLIRDLAQRLGKKLDLVIHGGDTEVDKSVIEELGDPLVHLLRNAADHGIDSVEDRVRAGKPPTGVITLSAAHEGSHVLVQVADDGKGLDRDRIARRAIERGLADPAEVEAMSDREVFRFIFDAGFSTADAVSDVSGRGVGMDVVRANVERIKGTIDLLSEPGRGTTVRIKIPLTVAIMQAMMVRIGEEIYAVPLESIIEIVKPEPAQLASINTQPVLRLRDSVLPLVDGAEAFGAAGAGDGRFVVVLAAADRRVGLVVSGLIGQQEIVVKRLDEVSDGDGLVSGATVREDGGVSLIVDVARLVRTAEQARSRCAA